MAWRSRAFTRTITGIPRRAPTLLAVSASGEPVNAGRSAGSGERRHDRAHIRPPLRIENEAGGVGSMSQPVGEFLGKMRILTAHCHAQIHTED
ncbi:MAG TPA: hypothetical protein VF637_04180, partial [Sphingomicrobium sp.]